MTHGTSLPAALAAMATLEATGPADPEYPERRRAVQNAIVAVELDVVETIVPSTRLEPVSAAALQDLQTLTGGSCSARVVTHLAGIVAAALAGGYQDLVTAICGPRGRLVIHRAVEATVPVADQQEVFATQVVDLARRIARLRVGDVATFAAIDRLLERLEACETSHADALVGRAVDDARRRAQVDDGGARQGTLGVKVLTAGQRCANTAQTPQGSKGQ